MICEKKFISFFAKTAKLKSCKAKEILKAFEETILKILINGETVRLKNFLKIGTRILKVSNLPTQENKTNKAETPVLYAKFSENLKIRVKKSYKKNHSVGE